jgi:hypothetical protein
LAKDLHTPCAEQVFVSVTQSFSDEYRPSADEDALAVTLRFANAEDAEDMRKALNISGVKVVLAGMVGTYATAIVVPSKCALRSEMN